MATASPDDGGGVDATGGGVDGGCSGGLLPRGESIEVEEVCGSSNPIRAPKRRAPSLLPVLCKLLRRAAINGLLDLAALSKLSPSFTVDSRVRDQFLGLGLGINFS